MITRAISSDGGVAVMAIDSTNIVRTMVQKHAPMSNLATVALGRLLTAASLIGSNLKGANHTLSITVDGGGPLGVLVAESDSRGNVRGFVTNKDISLPLNKNGFPDVGAGVGNAGTLTLIRDFKMKEPQIGQVDVFSGEIGEDITYYFAQSEQVPTVCALGVLLNADGSLKSAGGFLAQLLPGAMENNIELLEQAIEKIPPVANLISNKVTTKEICELLLDGQDAQILDESSVNYVCNCSKNYFKNILMGIGKEELNDIIETDGETTLTCEYCNTDYHFSKEILESLVRKIDK